MTHPNDVKCFKAIKPLIEKGDTLVDVGACYGEYTDFFLKRLKSTGLIIAFEINPVSYKALKAKYKKNKNVSVLNWAVSDDFGTIPYYNGANEQQFNIVGHDVYGNKNRKMGKIQANRLDGIFDTDTKVKLVKIDVECAEIKVLKGMSEMVANVEYILLESHLDEDWPEIFKIITTYGFSGYNVETGLPITHEKRPYLSLLKNERLLEE